MEKMRKIRETEPGGLGLIRSDSRCSSQMSSKNLDNEEDDLKTPTVEELAFPGQKVNHLKQPFLRGILDFTLLCFFFQGWPFSKCFFFLDGRRCQFQLQFWIFRLWKSKCHKTGRAYDFWRYVLYDISITTAARFELLLQRLIFHIWCRFDVWFRTAPFLCLLGFSRIVDSSSSNSSSPSLNHYTKHFYTTTTLERPRRLYDTPIVENIISTSTPSTDTLSQHRFSFKSNLYSNTARRSSPSYTTLRRSDSYSPGTAATKSLLHLYHKKTY